MYAYAWDTQTRNTRALARLRAHTQAHTQAHARTHARTHTHTHARTRTRHVIHAGERACARAHRHTQTHTHTRKRRPFSKSARSLTQAGWRSSDLGEMQMSGLRKLRRTYIYIYIDYIMGIYLFKDLAIEEGGVEVRARERERL